MSIKDFKISAVDTSKGLALGEYKAEEKVQAKADGRCSYGSSAAVVADSAVTVQIAAVGKNFKAG